MVAHLRIIIPAAHEARPVKTASLLASAIRIYFKILFKMLCFRVINTCVYVLIAE